MSLRILKAGVLDTIQDMGRFGYQYLGVNPSGAMDLRAAAISNALVGNKMNDAVIEMHFPAPVILFDKPAVIALSGADFQATIDGHPIPVNHTLLVGENTVLQFHSLQQKSRCYLSVAGGLKIDKWLNSYSTNLKASAGGLHGRKFAKGDTIETRNGWNLNRMLGNADFKILPWCAPEERDPLPPEEIWILPGNEWSWLKETSRKKFLHDPFEITANSDRMGYRLSGKGLQTADKRDLVSSAVCFGTIQLLPDGQLIILMAGHQTTGGYPRVGYVISAHRSKLAQMKAGNYVRFALTNQQAAEDMLLRQQRNLSQLEMACKLRLQTFLHENH